MADTFAARVPGRPHVPGFVAAAVVSIAVAFPLGFGTAKWTTDSGSKSPVVVAPVPHDDSRTPVVGNFRCHLGGPC